ncbi:MAG: histone deacetylase [Firmicutes bacterium]|nr:histone deacetylase [Bacillota bacterium]
MPVAVTYHEDFGYCGYIVLKDRVIPSFNAVRQLLPQEEVKVFTPEVTDDTRRLVETVHTRNHIEDVRYSGYLDVSMLSLASVVMAAELVASGEFHYGFAYVGAAGHHASREGFWGFCYLNDVAAAIIKMREKGLKRFLILDVDPHFGDGTRNILGKDPDVIHINFDTNIKNRFDAVNNNYDYGLGIAKDPGFLAAVDESLKPEYEFDMMFVIFGHDSHTYDYGGFTLTYDAYPELSRKVKRYAGDRPLLWVLSGGSEVEVAVQVIPDILRVLIED